MISGAAPDNTTRPDEQARFLSNLADARENGYALVCAVCGCGIYDDGDLHDESLHGARSDADVAQNAGDRVIASGCQPFVDSGAGRGGSEPPSASGRAVVARASGNDT